MGGPKEISEAAADSTQGSWRERALPPALRILTTFWVLLLLWTAYVNAQGDLHTGPAVIAVAISAACLVGAMRGTRLPPLVRRSALNLPFLVAGSISLLTAGVYPGPTLALGLFVCLTALFFRPRWAVLAGLLAFLPFAVAAFWSLDGWTAATAESAAYVSSAHAWNRATVTTAIIFSTVVLVVHGILGQLERALRSQASILDTTRAEVEARASSIEQRRSSERELIASHKMDALGKLAVGVSHDYNNELVVILGWLGLLRRQEAPDDALIRRGLEAIRRAATEGADVTARLLAMSPGRTGGSSGFCDVDEAVARLLPTLSHLFPEDTSVDFEPSGGARAAVEPGDLAQIVLALALSTRHDFAPGHRLSIAAGSEETQATVTVDVDRAEERRRFVVLSFTDTAHEPLEPKSDATAVKDAGADEGALASAHAMLESHGGWLEVPREGGGALLARAFLPAAAAEVSEESVEPIEAGDLSGKLILLAEDDGAILRLLTRILRGAGATVLPSANGDEALEAASKSERAIDLFCTDGVMPGLNTADCIERVRELHPDAAVIVLSGHLPEELTARRIDLESWKLLAKPITAKALLDAAARALASGRSAPSDPPERGRR